MFSYVIAELDVKSELAELALFTLTIEKYVILYRVCHQIVRNGCSTWWGILRARPDPAYGQSFTYLDAPMKTIAGLISSNYRVLGAHPIKMLRTHEGASLLRVNPSCVWMPP